MHHVAWSDGTCVVTATDEPAPELLHSDLRLKQAAQLVIGNSMCKQHWIIEQRIVEACSGVRHALLQQAEEVAEEVSIWHCQHSHLLRTRERLVWHVQLAQSSASRAASRHKTLELTACAFGGNAEADTPDET